MSEINALNGCLGGDQAAEPRVVQLILDTNVWLDWFVFAQAPDSPIAQLQQCVMHGVQQGAIEYRVLMTPPMWDEWVDVLGR